MSEEASSSGPADVMSQLEQQQQHVARLQRQLEGVDGSSSSSGARHHIVNKNSGGSSSSGAPRDPRRRSHNRGDGDTM